MKIGFQTILFAAQQCTLPEMLDAIVSAGGQGVEFFQEPRQISGPNWGAGFRDPDGHILSIFGPK